MIPPKLKLRSETAVVQCVMHNLKQSTCHRRSLDKPTERTWMSTRVHAVCSQSPCLKVFHQIYFVQRRSAKSFPRPQAPLNYAARMESLP